MPIVRTAKLAALAKRLNAERRICLDVAWSGAAAC